MGSARATAPDIKSPNFVKDSVTTLQKIPEGSQRSMAFLGLMADSVGGGIMGRRGKATMTGDVGAGPFRKFTEKAEQDMKEEQQSTKNTSEDDFGIENVRKRLLERAKQERIARQNQFTREKEVYDQSLPDSVKKEMKKSPLQFMVRGG